jgi:hypothetical protein
MVYVLILGQCPDHCISLESWIGRIYSRELLDASDDLRLRKYADCGIKPEGYGRRLIGKILWFRIDSDKLPSNVDLYFAIREDHAAISTSFSLTHTRHVPRMVSRGSSIRN